MQNFNNIAITTVRDDFTDLSKREKYADCAKKLSRHLKKKYFLDYAMSLTDASFSSIQIKVLDVPFDICNNSLFIDKIKQAISDLNDDCKITLPISQYYISHELNYIPEIKLFENGNAFLNLNEEITLANCHKIFTDCNSFEINNCHFVQGNILGLLLLNNKWFYLKDSGKYPWSKIVKKHLQEGKDLLECQEELINNGLKVYAKL